MLLREAIDVEGVCLLQTSGLRLILAGESAFVAFVREGRLAQRFSVEESTLVWFRFCERASEHGSDHAELDEVEAGVIADAMRYDVVYLTVCSAKNRRTPCEIIHVVVVVRIDRRREGDVGLLEYPFERSDGVFRLNVTVYLRVPERIGVVGDPTVFRIREQNVDLGEIHQSSGGDGGVLSRIATMDLESFSVVNVLYSISIVTSGVPVDVDLPSVRISDRKVIKDGMSPQEIVV